MQLYKYCTAQNLSRVLDQGCIRLGTLADYAKTSAYGDMVSDSHEGTKVVSGRVVKVTESTSPHSPEMRSLKSMGIELHASSGGTIQNIVFEHARVRSPNVLVFSASSEYSPGVHDQWKAAEGYDSCYQITSARLFYRAISAALGPEFSFLGAAPIVYEDDLNLSDPRAATHPAFVKRKGTFATQSEFRAVWAARSLRDLTPILIESSGAKLYARTHPST